MNIEITFDSGAVLTAAGQDGEGIDRIALSQPFGFTQDQILAARYWVEAIADADGREFKSEPLRLDFESRAYRMAWSLKSLSRNRRARERARR